MRDADCLGNRRLVSRLCTSENAPARSFPANSKCSRFIWVRFRTVGGMFPVTDKRSSCRERPVVAAKIGRVISVYGRITHLHNTRRSCCTWGVRLYDVFGLLTPPTWAFLSSHAAEPAETCWRLFAMRLSHIEHPETRGRSSYARSLHDTYLMFFNHENTSHSESSDD